MSNFTALLSFYAHGLSSFLMAEPICYLFGAVILCFIVVIVQKIVHLHL